MKKICKALLILLSLTLLLSGCSSTEPADNSKGNTAETGEPQYGGTYIMVSNGEPSSFNPNWKTDDMQLPATYNIFNRLVGFAQIRRLPARRRLTAAVKPARLVTSKLYMQ